MQRQHCSELFSMLQQVSTFKAIRFVFFQYTWVDILQGLSFFASEAIYHFPFSSLPICHNSRLRDGSFEAALDPTQAERKTMLHEPLTPTCMQVKCTV
jgi:hypothetical protein